MGERDKGKPQRKDLMNNTMSPDVPRESVASASTPALDDDLQIHIGRQLRAVYDEVARQPVPDRFLRLLEDLERKQAEKS